MELSPQYFDRQDMAPCNTLHFRPQGALVGDMSFYQDGNACHIFYLSKRNDDPPRLPRCEMDHAVSKDLLHWECLPPALLPGKSGEPDDDGIGGATIAFSEGKYHMFYAGTNPQVIYRALSDDLIKWEKDNPLTPIIVPDPRWYTAHDTPVNNPYLELGWRDPFLIYDDENESYAMITTARINHGPILERGCVSLTVSKDLKNWEVKPPLYSPGIGTALEVAEIFKMDGRYYLFFCNGETNTVRYRVSDRLEGPYRCPIDDILLPPYMYAPRSATSNGKRYLLPWAADRLDGRDDYLPGLNFSKGLGETGFAWGGVLGTPQHIRTTPDGGLGLFYPGIVDSLAGAELISPNLLEMASSERGEWKPGSGGLSASSDQGFARAVLAAGGRDYIFYAKITIKRGVAAGVILRADENGEGGYFLRIEPGTGSVSLWRYPRIWMRSRPLGIKINPELLDYNRPLELKIILHRHILDAYLDDRHVISCAVHDYKEGKFGVFVEDAEAEFSVLKANEIRE